MKNKNNSQIGFTQSYQTNKDSSKPGISKRDSNYQIKTKDIKDQIKEKEDIIEKLLKEKLD